MRNKVIVENVKMMGVQTMSRVSALADGTPALARKKALTTHPAF